VTLLQPYCVKP